MRRDALGEVLSHLKQSVEQLTADNERLTLQNNALKQEAYQLQAQLGQLRQQEDALNKTAQRLRGNNPRWAQQISRLEEENLDLDKRIKKTCEGIKFVGQALSAADKENQPEASPIEAHKQKEKLKLMKMIYDSQQRQEVLRRSIEDYEKQMPAPPAHSALVHPALSSNQWDDTQLSALAAQLKKLEQNYDQLKELLRQMGPKFQKTQMTASQHAEQSQLEGNVHDLTSQEAGLKADLEDLRSQMVGLDKRKSSLEMLIKQQTLR